MQTIFDSIWLRSFNIVLKHSKGILLSKPTLENPAIRLLQIPHSPRSILKPLTHIKQALGSKQLGFNARLRCLRIHSFLILGLTVGSLISIPNSSNAQLYIGSANSDVKLESLHELVLYDSVSKSQVLAFEFTFRSDEMPLGIIVPVTAESQQAIGKPVIFSELIKLGKPKQQQQRKLKLSFISYLWRLLTMKTRPPRQESRPKQSVVGAIEGRQLSHQQTVDWAINQGLYVPLKTAKSLHVLANLGHRFNVLLIEPAKLKRTDIVDGKHIFRSPTLYVRSRTQRPQTLDQAFSGTASFPHTINVVSDRAFSLGLAKQQSYDTVLRSYLSKQVIKKLLNSMPKSLHTYERAAYLQTFELPQSYSGRVKVLHQRIPSTVKPKDIASYEPMLITLPIEVLLGLLLLGSWAWNRERSPLRNARSNRIRPR
jgi:hypothetical protein